MKHVSARRPESAKLGTEREQVCSRYASGPGDTAAAKPTSATKSKHCDIFSCYSFDANKLLDRLRGMGTRLSNYRVGCLFDGHIQRVGHTFLYDGPSLNRIEFPPASQEVIRINVAECDPGISNSGIAAAKAITRWPWYTSCAFRPHLQLPRFAA